MRVLQSCLGSVLSVFLLSGCVVVTPPASHYPDLGSGLSWPHSEESGVEVVEYRFNCARAEENRQLGTRLPGLFLPPGNVWEQMSQQERAVWLVNRERVDRGLLPLQGIEPRVSAVSARYAAFLMEHEEFGHYEDGRSPWQRLEGDPAINSCHDFLGIAENLAIFFGGWTMPVERAVYMWMYDDRKSGWGHRHALLWASYLNNSGTVASEGLTGVGIAVGTHRGWPDSTVIVMNFVDPCPGWTSATLLD